MTLLDLITKIQVEDEIKYCLQQILFELHHKKTCFKHMRTLRTHISLCIMTVESVTSLFATKQMVSIDAQNMSPSWFCCCVDQFQSHIVSRPEFRLIRDGIIQFSILLIQSFQDADQTFV